MVSTVWQSIISIASFNSQLDDFFKENKRIVVGDGIRITKKLETPKVLLKFLPNVSHRYGKIGRAHV